MRRPHCHKGTIDYFTRRCDLCDYQVMDWLAGICSWIIFFAILLLLGMCISNGVPEYDPEYDAPGPAGW